MAAFLRQEFPKRHIVVIGRRVIVVIVVVETV